MKVLKNLPRLFKANATARILPQPPTFARIEVKAHLYNSYTISREIARTRLPMRRIVICFTAPFPGGV
jgi:hypothetical protein